MKKSFSMIIGALLLGFTACEDVPAPYGINWDGEETSTEGGELLPFTSSSLNDFTTLAVTEEYNPWSVGSSYTQATGYQKWDGSDAKSNKEVEGYLISPALNTTSATNLTISFDYCVGYANNDAAFAQHIKILVSKDADVQEFNKDQWKELNWTATHTSTDWTLKTETITLSEEFVGVENVRVAFWFYAPAANSCTFELKNFKAVDANQATEDGGNNTPDTSLNGVPYTSNSLQEGWKTWASSGKNNPWSQGSSYTQATGFQKWSGDTKSNREVDGYLISPAFNTTVASGKVKMSFENCVAYVNNDPDYAKHIKLYISKTADGTNFNAAEWEQLDWTATHESTNWTLTTDEVQLPEAYVNQDNVHVAFWFYAPADKSSTFELKTFRLLEGKVEEVGGGDNPGPGPSGSSEGVSISDNVLTLTNTAVTAGTETELYDLNTLNLNDAESVTTVEGQNFTMVFGAGTNTNAPKFYTKTKGVRVYANNTITFTGTKKAIAKVEITCDVYNNIKYVGNATATLAVEGNTLVYTNTSADAGTQLRAQTVKVTFAK